MVLSPAYMPSTVILGPSLIITPLLLIVVLPVVTLSTLILPFKSNLMPLPVAVVVILLPPSNLRAVLSPTDLLISLPLSAPKLRPELSLLVFALMSSVFALILSLLALMLLALVLILSVLALILSFA